MSDERQAFRLFNKKLVGKVKAFKSNFRELSLLVGRFLGRKIFMRYPRDIISEIFPVNYPTLDELKAFQNHGNENNHPPSKLFKWKIKIVKVNQPNFLCCYKIAWKIARKLLGKLFNVLKGKRAEFGFGFILSF